MTRRAAWIDQAQRLTMAQAVAILGVYGCDGSRRQGIGPCPACGQESGRGSGDRRRPIHWGQGGSAEGWACASCGARGDALQLVSWFVARSTLREAGKEGQREVRGFLAAAGVCDPVPDEDWRPRAPVPPRAPPAVEEVREQPPAAEVAALWALAVPVDADAEVADYLAGRGLDPFAVSVLDLARALPVGAACPRWARCAGRRWSETHRLLLRVVGPDGRTQSLRARSVLAGLSPKVAAAGGSPAGGMVYADRAARRMLHRQEAGRLVVVEGDPDWLTWATQPAPTWGTLGIWSGAWSPALAAAIPDGSEVVLRPHEDEDGTGDRYADQVVETLRRRRVRVLRRSGR